MIYIKDTEFIRGNCPMTKEEVRILSVAKLELEEKDRVLDIGAGTGSVSIQIAKICCEGEVLAIEKDIEAIDILYKNKEKFAVDNMKVLEGEALALETSLEGEFDKVFIGGSGGNIEQIIEQYGKRLKENGMFVLNFITIDNLYKAMNTLKALKYEIECTQVAISKTRGQSYMMSSNNPIFIVAAKK